VLTRRGFEVHATKTGWWLTVPSRILLTLGGPAFRAHIPERLAYYRGDRLEVALYPNCLLLRGSQQDTAWAHGFVVENLTAAPALQTFDPPSWGAHPWRTTSGRSSIGRRCSSVVRSAASRSCSR